MFKNVHIHIPFPELIKRLDMVAKNKLNVEIYFNQKTLDHCKMNDVYKAQDVLAKNDLQVTFHAPFMDLSPGGVDNKVRQLTVDRFLQVIKLAEIFSPKVIVFHPGYDKWRFDSHWKIWLKNSIKTWTEILEKSSKFDFTIAVENVFETKPNTIASLIKEIDSPRLKFCFDVGHFNLFTETSMEKWFKSLGNSIAEVHLHDNHATKDEHLALGDAGIDFERFFQLLQQYDSHPVVTVEAHNEKDLWKSLKYLQPFTYPFIS